MTEEPGLYGKYIIQKSDGSPVDLDADYFILRLDKPENLYERRALWFYADCIAEENPQLHADIKNRIMEHDLRIAVENEVYNEVYEDDEPLSPEDQELVERSWQEFKSKIEHVDRVMHIPLEPKPGEPIAWIDGEPVYREDDRPSQLPPQIENDMTLHELRQERQLKQREVDGNV